MMVYRTILLLAFILFSVDTLGGIKTLSCANCSYIQKERIAETVARTRNSQKVVVMDYANESAIKFKVYLSESRGEPIISVYQEFLSADEMHDVNVIFEYRRAMVGMLKAAEQKPIFDTEVNRLQIQQSNSKPIPSVNVRNENLEDGNYYSVGNIKVRVSPFDFATTSQIRNNTYDYYMGGFKGQFAEIVSGTLNKINIPSMKEADLKLGIQFVEYDENFKEINIGRASVVLDFDREKLDFLFLKDKDNNSIPTNKSDAPGTYEFDTQEGYDIFRTYVVDVFGGGGGGGSDCRVTKTKNINGRWIFTFTC